MTDNLEQTWDALYEEETTSAEEPTSTPPSEPELKPLEAIDEEIKPVADSPEGLEAVAQATSDLDADDIKPEPEKPENAEPPKPAGEEEKENVKMSYIESYLAQFDVEGGMIQFEDGSSTHFDELDDEKKTEILNQLHTSQVKTVESKYGLDENEIGLINYLRTNKLTVEDMIEQMATDRVKVLDATREIDTMNYKEMSDEAIYLHFLKKSSPEAAAEQLEEDLEKAKLQSNFSKVSASLRTQLAAEQSRTIDSKLSESKQVEEEVIENQRKEVVNAVAGITDIAGVALNDTIKNGILDKVLEVNDYGDSRFMEEAFSDPKRLFNAAFWYYYGKDILDQRDNYWKQEKSKAYKRGRQEALGDDGTKISFSASSQKPVSRDSSTEFAEDDDWLSLHQ